MWRFLVLIVGVSKLVEPPHILQWSGNLFFCFVSWQAFKHTWKNVLNHNDTIEAKDSSSKLFVFVLCFLHLSIIPKFPILCLLEMCCNASWIEQKDFRSNCLVLSTGIRFRLAAIDILLRIFIPVNISTTKYISLYLGHLVLSTIYNLLAYFTYKIWFTT